jgi:hypothetical protein
MSLTTLAIETIRPYEAAIVAAIANGEVSQVGTDGVSPGTGGYWMSCEEITSQKSAFNTISH